MRWPKGYHQKHWWLHLHPGDLDVHQYQATAIFVIVFLAAVNSFYLLTFAQLIKRMCITEIWKYCECGCKYYHPIPCHDRIVQSPTKAYQHSEHWSLVSKPSSSSLSSLFSSCVLTEAPKSALQNSSQPDSPGSEDQTDAAYNHRLHLVRTCSLRRTNQRTFLEPICDDCLLLELGLASESSSSNITHDGDHGERNLEGAEWLLESSVEITVEPPGEDDEVCSQGSKPGPATWSSDDESGDDTARKGRGRERRSAVELRREALTIGEASPLRRRDSLQKVETGQHLRRARKQQDLGTTSSVDSSLSKSSSIRPLSWIEHLKSDIGHRVRRRTPDLPTESESGLERSTQRNESPIRPSSSTTEEYRIPSLPSIPATASSTFSAISGSFEESVLLPLDQIISSSDFDSSLLSNPAPHSDTNPELLKLKPIHKDAIRKSTSSTRSAQSFHTTFSNDLPTLSSVRSGHISLHPLSHPLLASARTNEGDGQDHMHPDDNHDGEMKTIGKPKEMDR